MKIGRFVALAAVALLVVGAIGVAASHSFAQTGQPPAAAGAQETTDSGQAVTSDPATVDEQVGDQDAPDSGEAVSVSDTDNVEEQAGDQNEAESGGAVSAQDTDNVQEEVGDQNAADSDVEGIEAGDGQEAAPTGTPAITADQAKATAEAYLNAGTATKVELDDENGQLVYSVEIGTSDVKVDAMTGAVLGVEAGED